MKTALGIILALVGLAADVFAANPSFQSFDTNDFIITPSLSNPRMIHARRSGVTNSWTNSVITYSNTVILIDGVNLTNFISGTAFMTNYTLVAGTNIVISTNVVGTNVTWTINATGGSSGTFTNYFLEAGTNIVVSTNTSGTNVTWTVNGVGDGVGALTNYFLEAGTNIVLTTNVVGTNVTWTVNSSGGGDDHLVFASGFDTNPGVLIDKMLAGVGITLSVEADTDDHVHVSIEPTSLTNYFPTINPTDGTIPVRTGTNSFGDSPFKTDQTTNIVLPSGYLGIGTNSGSHPLHIFALDRTNGAGVPLEPVMIENPDRTSIYAQANIAFKVWDGAADTTIGWVGVTSGSYTFAPYANATYLENWGSGGIRILSDDPTYGLIAFYTGGYTNDTFKRMVIEATGEIDAITQMRINYATVTNNISSWLSVGSSTVVDVSPSAPATQTNVITGTMTFTHATNGVDKLEVTHERTFLNGSGSDQTINLPANWHKGPGAATSIVVTNGTVVELYVKSKGPTSSAALQTNVYVSVLYYP